MLESENNFLNQFVMFLNIYLKNLFIIIKHFISFSKNSWLFSTLSKITIPMHFFEMYVSRFMIQIYKENKNYEYSRIKEFFIVVCTLTTTGDKHEAVFHAYWKDFLYIYWNALWNVLFKLNGLMYLWWSLKWCRNFKT